MDKDALKAAVLSETTDMLVKVLQTPETDPAIAKLAQEITKKIASTTKPHLVDEYASQLRLLAEQQRIKTNHYRWRIAENALLAFMRLAVKFALAAA